ncbi:MAG: accessory gene regulator B family protein [Hungatella sp.]|jgi:accessory gene regulator B|nr:accessory gene regulator B family protein [Hungatella sp.]
MIEKMAKSLVVWQTKKKYLSEKDCNLYIYGYELLIGQVVNLFIACFLAFVFGAYLTVIVFLLTFIPLRSYAGGHHADSYNVCTIISNIIICAVCVAAKVIPKEMVFLMNITAGIVSGILIFRLAPVENHNKRLELIEKKHHRKYSILIWGIESIIWILAYYLEAKDVSFAVTSGHLSLSVLLCAGVLKNKFLSKD